MARRNVVLPQIKRKEDTWCRRSTGSESESSDELNRGCDFEDVEEDEDLARGSDFHDTGDGSISRPTSIAITHDESSTYTVRVVDRESEKEDDETDSESDESERIVLVKTQLSKRISVQHPKSYSLSDVKARPWSFERRLKDGGEIWLGFQEVSCSDVYEIVKKSAANTSHNLTFEEKDKHLITFIIAVKQIFRGAGVAYEARVKFENQWKNFQAFFEDGVVVFHATQVESLYIVCYPAKNTYIITPQENILNSKYTNNVSLEFPRDSVTKNEKAFVQFSPVDSDSMRERHRLFPDKFKLKAVSQRVYMEHEIPKIMKSVSANLQLESFTENVDESLDLVYLQWKDGDVNVLSKEDCNMHRDDKKVKTSVADFVSKSGISVGLAVPGFTSTDKHEIKLAYRDEFICKLVIYIKIKSPLTATIYIDCARLEILHTLEKENEKLTTIGKSEDIYLKDFQRIRVDIAGNSVRPKERNQQDKCFLTFFASAEKNQLSFDIEKRGGMGVQPTTKFKFHLDNLGSKSLVHQQDFDPWLLRGARERGDIVGLSRGFTSLDFKTPR